MQANFESLGINKPIMMQIFIFVGNYGQKLAKLVNIKLQRTFPCLTSSKTTVYGNKCAAELRRGPTERAIFSRWPWPLWSMFRPPCYLQLKITPDSIRWISLDSLSDNSTVDLYLYLWDKIQGQHHICSKKIPLMRPTWSWIMQIRWTRLILAIFGYWPWYLGSNPRS